MTNPGNGVIDFIKGDNTGVLLLVAPTTFLVIAIIFSLVVIDRCLKHEYTTTKKAGFPIMHKRVQMCLNLFNFSQNHGFSTNSLKYQDKCRTVTDN